MRSLDRLPTLLGRMMRPGRLRSIVVEYTFVASALVFLLYAMGLLSFKRNQPPRGITSLDQLVAHLPETRKFALVERGGQSYVVWIGTTRGVIVSGPPVYVFDRAGTLVDRVGDVGDSYNPFVGESYSLAYRAPAITPEEALAYCRQRQAATP